MVTIGGYKVENRLFFNLFAFDFVIFQEQASHYGATDAMPCAGNGTWQHSQRLGSEESACQHGGKTSILHPHLNRYGSLLGSGEARQPASQPTKEVSQ